MKRIYTSAFLMGILLSGCYREPDFDSVPKIEYVSVTKNLETDPLSGNKLERVTVTVSFEDKDGDLGTTAEERGDPAFTSRYDEVGNYELVTVRKELNGELTETILGEDKPKWMPILKPDKGNGPIQGKLDYNLTKYYGNSSVMIEEKYKVRIRDRALHYSNQVETDFISVPGYR